MSHRLIEMDFTGSGTDHFLDDYQLTCLAHDMRVRGSFFLSFFNFIGIPLYASYIKARCVITGKKKVI